MSTNLKSNGRSAWRGSGVCGLLWKGKGKKMTELERNWSVYCKQWLYSSTSQLQQPYIHAHARTHTLIFFALCLLLLTWSIAGVDCRACHSSGTFFLCDTHTQARTHVHKAFYLLAFGRRGLALPYFSRAGQIWHRWQNPRWRLRVRRLLASGKKEQEDKISLHQASGCFILKAIFMDSNICWTWLRKKRRNGEIDR